MDAEGCESFECERMGIAWRVVEDNMSRTTLDRGKCSAVTGRRVGGGEGCARNNNGGRATAWEDAMQEELRLL